MTPTNTHPETSEPTAPYHIRHADTVIREFVNTELNEIQTFTDDGEPIIEVEGEPLTRRHIDEALTTLFENTTGTDSETQHFIATVERRLGETEITQQRPFTLPANTDIDPFTAVTNYYAEFWGSETEQSAFNDHTYVRPDGGEQVCILSVTEIPAYEYQSVTEHVTEIKQIPDS